MLIVPFIGLHGVCKVEVYDEEKDLTCYKQHNSLTCVQQYNPVTQFVNCSTYEPDCSSNSYHLTLLKSGRSEPTQPNFLDGQTETQPINNEFQKQSHKINTEYSDSVHVQNVCKCSQNMNILHTDQSSSHKCMSSSGPSLIGRMYGNFPSIASHAEMTNDTSSQITASPDNLKNVSSFGELDTTSLVEKIFHLLVPCVDLNIDKNELRKKVNEILNIGNVKETPTKSPSEMSNADVVSESSNNICNLELVIDERPATSDLIPTIDNMASNKNYDTVVTYNSNPNTSNGSKVTDLIERIRNAEKMQLVNSSTHSFNEEDYDVSFSSNNKELQSKGSVGKEKCNRRKEKNKSKLSVTPTSKLRWTVNRNLRMHKYHRKCRTTPPDLNEDMYSSSKKGYYCPDCQFIFKGRKKLLLHKQLKNGNCLPDCIYCDADEERKQVYHCDKCPKCFQTSEMLERHLVKHAQNQFSCYLCNVQFYTILELKGHTQSMHSDTIQQEHLCDLCGSKFKEKKVLNAHVKYVHSESRPERCSYCDKCFKTKSQLKNHLVTHKSISDLNLSCEVCGRGFLRKATLKEHVRRHRKEFAIFCTVCSKGFYRQYDLEEHMRVHTGDKPFACKLCGFKCALSCNLVKHMKVHQKQGLK